jgi:thiosulfate dehydrogenase [quinone] large subunit
MATTATLRTQDATERPSARPARGAGEFWLAALRIGVGFIFVWAFVDKLFGLGYSTASAKSVLNGGSPTKGFLSHVAAGPFQSFFHSIAGNPIVDILFMVSLLGIGVALITGAGLRVAAVSNVVLMLGMWAAEWPMAKVVADGSASGSTNPFMDYHLAYALVGIVCAYLGTGSAFGLGQWWSRQSFVRKHQVLL